jgi:radical SAM superfamily enzyme YgiQ (UPF0313 family)
LEGLSLRGISWCVPNGVEANTLDRSLLEKMRDSGCSDLSIAVETASSRIQKLIHKFVDLEKVKQTIRDMRELGIYSKVFFMVGFPGETKEDIQETIDFASELKADWSSLSIVNPLPGTEIGERVKIDYRDIGYANANIQTEDFTPQEIEKIVQEANTRINFIENPNKIFNRDIAIRDFRRIAERYPNHLVARRELENLYNR